MIWKTFSFDHCIFAVIDFVIKFSQISIVKFRFTNLSISRKHSLVRSGWGKIKTLRWTVHISNQRFMHGGAFVLWISWVGLIVAKAFGRPLLKIRLCSRYHRIKCSGDCAQMYFSTPKISNFQISSLLQRFSKFEHLLLEASRKKALHHEQVYGDMIIVFCESNFATERHQSYVLFKHSSMARKIQICRTLGSNDRAICLFLLRDVWNTILIYTGSATQIWKQHLWRKKPVLLCDVIILIEVHGTYGSRLRSQTIHLSHYAFSHRIQ